MEVTAGELRVRQQQLRNREVGFAERGRGELRDAVERIRDPGAESIDGRLIAERGPAEVLSREASPMVADSEVGRRDCRYSLLPSACASETRAAR